MNARARGLTLVELLVAVALGLLVLAVASNLLISSSRTASDVQARNELLQEGQIAQNYLAAQLREAAHVFLPGTVLDLGGPGWGLGQTSWTVGDPAQPAVALVRPPRVLGANCPAAPEQCYQFLAYLAVPRQSWVEAASGPDDPGADPRNADRWVLVEVRRLYAAGPPAASLGGGAYTPPPGDGGRLLLDYVRPAEAPPLFVVNGSAQAPGQLSVDINLALSRRLGGQELRVPAAGDTPAVSVTTVQVAPRNLGNLP